MTDAVLPVTFLSDYGHADEFVAVVKGVMLQIVPNLGILDVTHEVPAGDIRAGALAYLRAVPYLPVGVHLAIVDPGVGTDRKALALRTGDGRVFVGPDNGLLSPAVAICGGAVEAVVLDPVRWRVPDPSPTFQGRDVFGPAAAALAAGVSLAEIGDPVDPHELVPLLMPLCQMDNDGRMHGVVLSVDRFGNCATNISEPDLAELRVAIGGSDHVIVRHGQTNADRTRMPLVRTFGEVEPGRPLAFIDSSGQLAFAVNTASAADELGLAAGSAVSVERSSGPELR